MDSKPPLGLWSHIPIPISLFESEFMALPRYAPMIPAGVCRFNVENNLTITKKITLLLLGPFFINESEIITSRQAGMMVWYVDLDTNLVIMSENNLLRNLYDFMRA